MNCLQYRNGCFAVKSAESWMYIATQWMNKQENIRVKITKMVELWGIEPQSKNKIHKSLYILSRFEILARGYQTPK